MLNSFHEVGLGDFPKTLILGSDKLADAPNLTRFFNIVRAHNTGAAFCS